MRVAIVRQHYRPDGHVERIAEPALEALLERNVAVSLYTRSWPQTRLQLIEPVICDPPYLGALWRDWGFARAACHLIRRAKPTLVESHERMLCCDVYRAGDGVHAVRLDERLKLASATERLSIMCSPRNRYLIDIERRMYASPWLRAVVCSSRMVKDELRSRFALPESKVPVIYDPVDSAYFHPGLREGRGETLDRHAIDRGATIFVTVATDAGRCGAGTAVDALARLDPPAHLIVVGDTPSLMRHGELARALGVAQRVTLAARSSDMRPYYGAADAFVLPSIYDPAPTTAVEAMACGVPVVTSTKCGAAELVVEHDAGLTCAAGDTVALAAHLRLLQDSAARTHFGANARRAVLPLSSSAITLQRVLLYRDLLAASGSNTPGRPTTVSRI